MGNQLCFRCFKIKGDYDVCMHCGYVESTKPEQVYQLVPGTILHDRYIIGTSIGFGGFGITYKAYDTVLSIVVAVKEFYPAGMVNRGDGEVKVGIFSGEKEEEFKRQLARFLEEARNMAIFSKEKDIINVYDYFEENQTAYIIMEYVDAPLLKTRLKEGKLPVEEATAYIVALLDALMKVHAKGIIHKDISPDNIFLTGKDTIKIFDFGAAKFKETESERTELAVVKAGYTPPEQYRSKDKQGAFMDIYAVGAVFYEMITGIKPMDAPERVIHDELEKPRDLGVQIDDKLERVMLKALALKPEHRFQTAEQFKKAILGKRKVDLPEEEIRKYRIRKKVLAIGSVGLLAIAGASVFLSQTIFSPKGRIDVSQIKEDKLEIWISSTDEAEGQELSKTLLESVEKECPQLSVSVEVIPEKEYTDKVQRAAADGSLPDVFCTEGIVAEEYCEELSKLLNTMKLSAYLQLGDLAEQKAVYQVPTAMQIGTVYVNDAKVKESPDTIDVKELGKSLNSLCYADETDAYSKFQNMYNSVSWLVGDLSNMDQVKTVTVDKIPPTDFKVLPILREGRLMGCMENAYGVNKQSSENQKEAGMFVISLLLSEGMQSTAYMNNEDGIPLNKAVYDSYQKYKMTTYLAFMKEYDMEDVEVLEGEDICQSLKEEIER